MRPPVSAWPLRAFLAAVASFSVAQDPVYTGPATRRTDIVLSEIMYAPAGDPLAANLEFIELYNSSPISEDLSGWTLRGSVDYTIPAGTRLAGGRFLTIAATPAALQGAGATGTVLGPWTGTLPNSSGTVRFIKASGGIVLETVYGDDPPWPLAADGAADAGAAEGQRLRGVQFPVVGLAGLAEEFRRIVVGDAQVGGDVGVVGPQPSVAQLYRYRPGPELRRRCGGHLSARPRPQLHGRRLSGSGVLGRTGVPGLVPQ